MDLTAFNLQTTPCLPLPRKRSPDGASTEFGGEHLIAAHYSFINFIVLKVNQCTCITPCMVQTTLKCSVMDHTAFNLQRTPCLPLPRKRSPDGASTECSGEHLIAAHYSFIDPERMKG